MWRNFFRRSSKNTALHKFKGIPVIFSYTGFNDINAIQYSPSALEHGSRAP